MAYSLSDSAWIVGSFFGRGPSAADKNPASR
eukprot:CAMPEP_0176417552 /NCGR_PEP_ID=MMETSP0127-20121128/6953_1 /TAXON_ID=938130 /ORGANISM="Platyophrya macrostoma, Strain WH" /LENGTH=30 /DNA_ID= /DNA_START= /DNA_END= /DNA_ORIENTATION=